MMAGFKNMNGLLYFKITSRKICSHKDLCCFSRKWSYPPRVMV